MTFKKSTLPEVVRHLPLERLVLETDAPYLAPVPHRGRRNESAYVKDTALKVAEIIGLPPEEVAAVVRFLLSDDASYITRSVIPVSGGL